MSEKILEIKELNEYKVQCGTNFKGEPYYSHYEGYFIKTEKREIYLLIESGRACCEDFGYFSTMDKPEDFIGSELIKVETVDSALKKEKLDEYVSESECYFVNFETSNGLFQIAVYNSHNGYYGHSVLFINGSEKVETGL